MFRILLQILNRPLGLFPIQFLSTDRPFTRLGLRAYRLFRRLMEIGFNNKGHCPNRQLDLLTAILLNCFCALLMGDIYDLKNKHLTMIAYKVVSMVLSWYFRLLNVLNGQWIFIYLRVAHDELWLSCHVKVGLSTCTVIYLLDNCNGVTSFMRCLFWILASSLETFFPLAEYKDFPFCQWLCLPRALICIQI